MEEKEDKQEDKEISESLAKKEESPPLPIPPEILESMPEEAKAAVERMSMMVAGGVMRSSNPLAEKLDGEHIHKILDYTNEESKRDDLQSTSNRRYVFAGFIVVLVIIAGLMVFFQTEGEKDILLNIIIGLATFAGGFGFGAEYGKRK